MRWFLALFACLACSGPSASIHTQPVVEEQEPPAPREWRVDGLLQEAPRVGRSPGEPVFQHPARTAFEALVIEPGELFVAVGSESTVGLVDGEGRVRATRRLFAGRRYSFTAATSSGVFFATPPGVVGSLPRPGAIQYWDLASNRVLYVAPLATQLRGIAADRRGTRLAVLTSESFDVLAIDSSSWVGTSLLDGPAQPTGSDVSIAPSGAFVHMVGAPGDETATFWSEEVGLTRGPGPLASAFHPRGGAWVTSTADGVEFLDPRDRSRSFGRVSLDFQPSSLQFSPDGSTLIARDPSTAVALVDPRDGSRVPDLPEDVELTDYNYPRVLDDGGLVRWDGEAVVVSHHGRDIARAALGESVPVPLGGDRLLLGIRSGWSIHSLPDLEPVAQLTPEGEASLWDAFFAEDGSSLVTMGRRGVETWGRGGLSARQCPGPARAVFIGPERTPRLWSNTYGLCDPIRGELTERPVQRVATHGDRGVGSSRARGFPVVDLRSADILRELPASCPDSGLCWEWIDISADGSRVTMPHARGGRVRVWSTSGRRIGEIRDTRDAEFTRLSPDGEVVLIMTHDAIRLHRARGPEFFRATRVPGRRVFAFSPDSTRFAFGTDAAVELVDLGSGATVATLTVADAWSVAFSSRGALIVTTEAGSASYDADGSPRVPIDDAGDLETVSIGPSGDRVARCERGDLQVRDALTGVTQSLGECTAGDRAIFSDDGRFVALLRGSEVRVHRLGTRDWMRLRVYRQGGAAIPVAVDNEGRYEVNPDHRAEFDDNFLYRREGDVRTAPMVSTTEVPPTPGLVAAFFAPDP